MRCKIADLIAEVPEAGGLPSRCRDYLHSGEGDVNITIRTDLYRRDKYHPEINEDILAYVESGYQFYLQLVDFDGLYLHSSGIEMDGRAYLFSGPCGTGKSTHAQQWQKLFGEAAQVFNDDKPAMRCLDGKWYAYGTPWCGKDGINQNKKVPLAGICFLKQAEENKIRRLSPAEATHRILSQTIFKIRDVERMDRLIASLEKLLLQIPVYELENRPEPEAARLSYETMRRGAEENGL